MDLFEKPKKEFKVNAENLLANAENVKKRGKRFGRKRPVEKFEKEIRSLEWREDV